MSQPAQIRIATHVEVAWMDAGETREATCPNCNYQGSIRQFLDIDYRPPDAVHHFVLQICPHCSVRFTDNPETMDYATDQLIEIGWHIYQTQIGAGVWPIAAPLTHIAKPVGARVLEIGGAYGFGLDFCIRARGWTGEGFDPSPLAEYGARELGLDIVQDYFTEAHLARGAYDVVIATEVIEHLAHPPAFLALMRRALADDGILVLSTPDAAWITPALDGAQLMTLLSPGAHVVLQTAESLNIVLAAAGFAHIIIQRSTTTLVAYASASPFTLDDDPATGRALYRNYLVARSKISGAESDLQLGFAGRGLFEAANDADPEAAAEAWAALRPAVQKRFGFDLETLDALPAATATAGLAELARLIPLGLGMILFGRANLLSAQHVPRATLLKTFQLAAAAAAALQNALAQRSLTDGLSASIINAASGEIALCHVEAGDTNAVPTLIAWSRRNASKIMPWRGFVGLVNAGAIEAAASLRHEMQLDWPDADLPEDLRRDALLSLANLALSPAGDTQRAFDYAEALQTLDAVAPGPIILQAFTRLVNASRYSDALDAARHHNLELLLATVSGKTAQDASLARIVLDLAAGDPAQIPARLANIEIEPSRRDVLLLEAFIRLVNASRYAEAMAFIAAHDITTLAARSGGDPSRNAAIARAVLDLANGDPLDVPHRLINLDIEPTRRDVLLLEAFIRLVNASRHQEAESFIEAHGILALATSTGGAPGRNANIALTVLELAVGNPLAIPERLKSLQLDPDRYDTFLLEAFIRLANASRYEDALAFAAEYDIPALAARASGKLSADAAIALAVLDLAAGDPAAVPERLKATGIPPARRMDLLLGAFTGLVNAGRTNEADALANSHRLLATLDNSDAAADARIAAVLLDLDQGRSVAAIDRMKAINPRPEDIAVLDALYVDGFVRLINEQMFAEAQTMTMDNGLTRRLAACADALRHDGLAATVILALQTGDAAAIPLLLEHARQGGLTENRLQELTMAAFLSLVNLGAFDNARALLPSVDPLIRKFRPPLNPAACNALFAAGMLALQDQTELTRASAMLARLRDHLVKTTPDGAAPDPLFWPALRGEILALRHLNRDEEANMLLANFATAYPGVPDDLLEQRP